MRSEQEGGGMGWDVVGALLAHYLMQVDQHICLGGMASCGHGDREGRGGGGSSGVGGSALLFHSWVSSQPVGWHNLQEHTDRNR